MLVDPTARRSSPTARPARAARGRPGRSTRCRRSSAGTRRTRRDQVVINDGAATQHDLHTGDHVKVVVANARVVNATISGIYKVGFDTGGYIGALFTPAQALQLFTDGTHYSSGERVGRSPASRRQTLTDRIAKLLPSGPRGQDRRPGARRRDRRHRQRAVVHQLHPARLRHRRPARRDVHHLQHLLDDRRAAAARTRAAARDRRQRASRSAARSCSRRRSSACSAARSAWPAASGWPTGCTRCSTRSNLGLPSGGLVMSRAHGDRHDRCSARSSRCSPRSRRPAARRRSRRSRRCARSSRRRRAASLRRRTIAGHRRRRASACSPPSAAPRPSRPAASAGADRARPGRDVRRGDAAVAGLRALDHRPARTGRRPPVRDGRPAGPHQRGAQPAAHRGDRVRADARPGARRRHRGHRLVGEDEPGQHRRHHGARPTSSSPRTASSAFRSRPCDGGQQGARRRFERPRCTGWARRSTATASTAPPSTGRSARSPTIKMNKGTRGHVGQPPARLDGQDGQGRAGRSARHGARSPRPASRRSPRRSPASTTNNTAARAVPGQRRRLPAR